MVNPELTVKPVTPIDIGFGDLVTPYSLPQESLPNSVLIPVLAGLNPPPSWNIPSVLIPVSYTHLRAHETR